MNLRIESEPVNVNQAVLNPVEEEVERKMRFPV